MCACIGAGLVPLAALAQQASRAREQELRLRFFDFVSLANVCHKLKLCVSLNVNVAVVCVARARPVANVELAGKALVPAAMLERELH